MKFGVDEAGKGPVLGSMFAAAVRAPLEALPDGIDDSKRLTDATREDLADRLRADDRVAVGLAEITPTRIDDGNMNDLTVAAHAEALSAVVEVGDAGLCDAGDVDADRFAARVAERVDADVNVAAEHGADGADELVGAASIVAKSARERHVVALSEEFGDVGSGYPSDPTTREFLRDHVERTGELPDCARTSWSTCDDVLAAAEQSALGDF
ncbi:ribonuclease HII [Natronomonas salina]|uniref:ribonuclease HII n=1 Tax=Natronomonas salina TaxID=1710540 RepID=UPI0015B567B9|nr:ribonuclease HII [Natronomonas salina]QLD90820.1 ribonuclease HII [Natronomonas salina]